MGRACLLPAAGQGPTRATRESGATETGFSSAEAELRVAIAQSWIASIALDGQTRTPHIRFSQEAFAPQSSSRERWEARQHGGLNCDFHHLLLQAHASRSTPQTAQSARGYGVPGTDPSLGSKARYLSLVQGGAAGLGRRLDSAAPPAALRRVSQARGASLCEELRPAWFPRHPSCWTRLGSGLCPRHLRQRRPVHCRTAIRGRGVAPTTVLGLLEPSGCGAQEPPGPGQADL